MAVLGIKPETQPARPAFYVPKYMQSAGYRIIPVPVYYPEVTHILGEPVYRKVSDIPDEIDMVNVFRRPQDIETHIDEIISKQPKSVWLQL
ncbi:CoA-binding protein, partial [Escherichia coli]|nr:CoA-binding protein [Escherichia coli]